MKFDREQLLHLARLAKLELTEEELQKAPQEFEQILNFITTLQEVDTTGVEPTSQITGLENRTREDVVTTTIPKQELLKSMPKTDEQGNLVVKAVFTESEE